MKTFGLSKYQTSKALEKLKFNKEYMRSNGVQIDNNIIPFADFVCNSYTNSDRYVAELQHRAWSVSDYANEKKLSNVFFSLTLPSVWHPMKTINYGKKNQKLVFNHKFGGRKFLSYKRTTLNGVKYRFFNADVKLKFDGLKFNYILDFSQTVDKYTPRNASKQLSKNLKKFFDDRSYKSIQKDERCYFRVTEPHKDGTPHIHMSLHVPSDKVDRVVKALSRLFPAPLGDIKTDVECATSYLMKYVLKTLDDLRDDSDKVTNLTLWYLYHGISRFYTSRTFATLEVYRKLNGMYNLIDLTKKVTSNEVNIFYYSKTKEIAFIQNEYGTIYIPKPMNWQDKLDNGYESLSADYESLEQPEEIKKPIPIIIDDEEFFIHQHHLKNLHVENEALVAFGQTPISLDDVMFKPKEQPYQMNDYKLFNYFEKLDIETVNTGHYINTRNLMIDRGYLEGERLKLNAIEDMFSEFEAEGMF